MNISYNNLKALNLTGGGGTRPLSGVSITWGVNQITQAVIEPVLGKKILPKAGETYRALEPEAGEIYSININNSYDILSGFIVTDALSTSAGSATSPLSAKSNLILMDEISRLNSYNPFRRIFRVKGDNYYGIGTKTKRTSDSKANILNPYDSMQTGNFKTNAIKGNNAFMSEYVVELCNALLKFHEGSPSYTIDDYIISTDDEVIEALRTGNIFSDKVSDYVASQVKGSWGSSTMINMLMSMSGAFDLKLIPTWRSSKYTLKPSSPLVYTDMVELPQSNIFSIRKQIDYDILPVTKVWINRPYSSNTDKTVKSSSGGSGIADVSKYFTWPVEDYEGHGNALIADIPWIYSGALDIDLQKYGPPNTMSSINYNARDPVITDSNNRVKPQVSGSSTLDINQVGTQVAKILFAEYVFNQSNMIINVPWIDIARHVKNLGKTYIVEVPYDMNVSSDTMTYWGYLQTVEMHIQRQTNTAIASIKLTHVRSESLNNQHGLREHPVYGGL